MCSACRHGWNEDGIEDEEEVCDQCDQCDHPISLHEKEYGCDYEADRPDPDIGQVAWRCGCKAMSRD